MKAPWIEENAERQRATRLKKEAEKQNTKLGTKNLLADEWNFIWTEYSKNPSRNPTAAQMAPLNRK